MLSGFKCVLPPWFKSKHGCEVSPQKLSDSNLSRWHSNAWVHFINITFPLHLILNKGAEGLFLKVSKRHRRQQVEESHVPPPSKEDEQVSAQEGSQQITSNACQQLISCFLIFF